MKKLLFISFSALTMSACGDGASTEAKVDTIITPQIQEIHESSKDVNAKSQELNEKADSLLNNI